MRKDEKEKKVIKQTMYINITNIKQGRCIYVCNHVHLICSEIIKYIIPTYIMYNCL